ncbi:nickel import ATP-binding protein NikD [Halalkalibacterium halodurans]|uniref:nickel import ATP-binding protein NikD n=3 Tax=Halalkalibacterium halodurans TaxID=86665 RepID=UPI002AA9BEF6|nr:nickel import ATP-binding protein NikD [Halalkalibacterium halodurans]MDY7221066.1 nickel import ATP-binding protein NikD [Halalkalibacterium halodurans]MDY7240305.1 nickel import ATP-binding protein NikD [Halalkalibacterium halodurans]MED4085984.1 nickel import ATP-binding protein NikD [Halalkalibacterium halodurans]MED4150592.1 nickel import ATP-binding protein NikD [Halalkalibacterium halodurans]MED4188560.1 nickel import ATP-binding protein NikD [Halalkalibacterium halodurans]
MRKLIKNDHHVLKVRNLNVKVKSDQGMLPLVQGLQFELKRGKVLGLVGESGSGKTMTCMSILQLLDRKTTCIEGSIQLQGRELNGLKAEDMRTIRGKEVGYIMQNPMNAFSPVFTIGNQFIETIRTHTELTKRQAFELAVASMETVHLPKPSELMRRYPFQLSGGMLQRVMIAISMCLRPSVVIADEPTTALDVTNQLQVLKELDRLRLESDSAILLISHDLGVIAELADEVAVMQKGRIVEKADVFQLFDHPQHEYTKKLLQARPTLPIYEQAREFAL